MKRQSTAPRAQSAVLTAVICCAVAVCVASAAHAAPPKKDVTVRVDQLHIEGVSLFKAGNHKAAVEKFRSAYELYPDPRLLYNIGRCHEALSELPEALAVYEQAINDPAAGAKLKAKSGRRAELVRRAQQALARTPAASSGGTRAGAGPAGAAAAGPVAPRVQPLAAPQPAQGESDSSFNPWVRRGKWVLAASSAALLAGGVTLTLLGVSDQNEVDDATSAAGDGTVNMTRAHALELQDDANGKKVAGYALMGVGAAAAIGAVALFLVDARGGKGEGASSTMGTRLAISPRPDGGALWVAGTF